MKLASVFVSRLTNERYGHLAQNTAHRNPKRKRGTLRVFLAHASGYEQSGSVNALVHRDSDSYCISPAESEVQRNAEPRAQRKRPMTPN